MIQTLFGFCSKRRQKRFPLDIYLFPRGRKRHQTLNLTDTRILYLDQCSWHVAYLGIVWSSQFLKYRSPYLFSHLFKHVNLRWLLKSQTYSAVMDTEWTGWRHSGHKVVVTHLLDVHDGGQEGGGGQFCDEGARRRRLVLICRTSSLCFTSFLLLLSNQVSL